MWSCKDSSSNGKRHHVHGKQASRICQSQAEKHKHGSSRATQRIPSMCTRRDSCKRYAAAHPRDWKAATPCCATESDFQRLGLRLRAPWGRARCMFYSTLATCLHITLLFGTLRTQPGPADTCGLGTSGNASGQKTRQGRSKLPVVDYNGLGWDPPNCSETCGGGTSVALPFWAKVQNQRMRW